MDTWRRSKLITSGYWRIKHPEIKLITVITNLIAHFLCIIDHLIIANASKDYIQLIEDDQTIIWNVPNIDKFPNTYPSHSIVYNSILCTPSTNKHKISIELAFYMNKTISANVFCGFTDNYELSTTPINNYWPRNTHFVGFEIWPRMYYSNKSGSDGNRFFIREISVKSGIVNKGKWTNLHLVDGTNPNITAKAIKYRMKRFIVEEKRRADSDAMNIEEDPADFQDFDPFPHVKNYGVQSHQVYGDITLSIEISDKHYFMMVIVKEFPNTASHHAYYYKCKRQLRDMQFSIIFPRGAAFNLADTNTRSADWVHAVKEQDL